MDLENPGRAEDIGWINTLRRLTKTVRVRTGSYGRLGDEAGEAEGGAGIFSREPFGKFGKIKFSDLANIYIDDAAQTGKVITLSEPVLLVEAGDVIGYTQSDSGGTNYVHWEVFTTEQRSQNISLRQQAGAVKRPRAGMWR
jgi:hypothetical protein